MTSPAVLRRSLVVLLLAVACVAWAPAAGAQTGSGDVRPPVLVTGDSLSHQAADDIAEALAALGYLLGPACRRPLPRRDPERTDRWQRYTSWVHRTVLGRDASGDELATWSDRLLAGHDRLAFTRLLTDSPEWAGAQIDDLYQRAFGRDAEPDGSDYWRGLVVGGMPLDVVAAHLFGSDEFFRAGSTPAGFVTALYRQVLHREPDGPGLAFWQRHLAGGTSRPTVAAAFYASPESRGDRVDVLYRSVLGREPDPAGRASWVDALPHMTDLRLAALLASSTEAFHRAQGGDSEVRGLDRLGAAGDVQPAA